MRLARCFVRISALALPFALSGCFVLSTTRKLPVPKLPLMEQTVTPEGLVDKLNQRWAALAPLSIKVEIQFSELKTKEGVARDFTSVPGLILIRKPDMLRIYGMVPVIRKEMFDMASDGKQFTLYVPHCNRVYKGFDTVQKKPASPPDGAMALAPDNTTACDANKLTEDLRPGFFLDAMVVRGLGPDDEYMVTPDTETVEDTSKKHLLFTPEYILNIMRSKPGTHGFVPTRVITFHRDDLLPYEQDLFDSDGNLETHISYANYQESGSGVFPSTITIKRPRDDFQIVLSIENVTEPGTLDDEQFVVNIPQGTEVKNLN